MTDVRCGQCNEINNCEAIKCESCRANLPDVNRRAPDVDDWEEDYRFIEEAELKGEVYGIENVCDANVFFEVLTVEETKPNFTEEHTFNQDISLKDPSISHKANESINPIFNNNEEQAQESVQLVASEVANSAGQYHCKICSKSFNRKASLKAHEDRVHNSDDTNQYDKDLEVIVPNSKRCVTPNFSESCDSEYEPPDDIEDYEFTVNKKQPQIPEKAKRKYPKACNITDLENNNSEQNSIPTSDGSPPQNLLNPKQKKPKLKRHMVYKCTACGKITRNYEEHINHIAIHEAPAESLTETTSLAKLKKTPSGFLKCKECKKVFMSEREFLMHERRYHRGESFQCDICQAFLTNRTSLRKHQRRTHNKKPDKSIRYFACVVCNQKFVSLFLLTHHRKNHTDAIKKVEEMTILKKGEDGKAVYVCKVCARTSKNRYRHEEHLRIHTKEKPYVCEVCGTKIATANQLAHHLRLHENDRPFKCDICDATYRHKKSLKKHLKLHTGERPFHCRYCEKTFAFNYTRAGHERRCHISKNKGTPRRPKRSNLKIVSNVEMRNDETANIDSVETGS